MREEGGSLVMKKKKEKRNQLSQDGTQTVGFLAGECQPGLVTRSL